MEDWHDYEWRKEPEKMDYRRMVEKWERWVKVYSYHRLFVFEFQSLSSLVEQQDS